ncbi:lantibiotic dehydratase [Nocardia arthritidis]|uniref:Lantibiotic dehydratase N-terminal domain-containing protein n=1 Tax=Nocardia arthritidis TaxID=228602 RepID=A0A6G9YRQ1_9NOCA|nr:lantibiotic dehydratase [Nocardia arthritidis]QIS15573.1 hypothetical protein F5544_38760 [Nocardia arthritidis]
MTTPDPRFSPYVLFRRGTLGLSELADLVPARAWDLLRRADEIDIDASTAQLEDELHQAIPTLSPEHRRAVLKLRRDVHNGRPISAAAPLEPLPTACRDLLIEWNRAAEQRRALLAQADATYRSELEQARTTLAKVALHEDFQRGLQLSGEDVYREVMAFAADPFDTGRKPSRTRRMESTITSFAYRVVFKPSPFGSFTEIGAHDWTAKSASGQRLSQVRLSVGLLAWMAHQLRLIDGADRVLRVRLNNSLSCAGDRAVFIRRPLEGADDGFTPDKVISARNTDLITLLRKVLGDGQVPERELRETLVEGGLSAEQARQTIDGLVKVGLCYRGIGLPDQATRTAEQLAARLREAGTAQAVACAEIFEELQGIEDRFAQSSPQARTELLGGLRACVGRFVDICQCSPPAKEAMRAAVYEDVGTRATAAGWRGELVGANADYLELYQRLVPVLDDATIEKMGLYAFYVRRYGEDGPPVPVAELFRAFDELSPQEASAVMCGLGDPAAARVIELRSEFFALLRDRVAEAGAADAVRLDPERLREFVRALPDTVPAWRSTAYRIQLDDDLLVVNGVTTGHGVFFSRYCGLLESGAEQWNLADELRTHIAATTPRQTDITAVLGLNFNMHPRLCPLELVYPGSVADPDGPRPLTIADLLVRADPRTRRLELISAVDGARIDLAPLNFLYPAAAPMLYRFLCVFAPTRTYRGGLWDQIDRHQSVGQPFRPRLMLGDLVLDRRSWRFPVSELPALAGLERQDLSALVEFDAWRQAAGLPRTTFFRVLAPRRTPDSERNLLEETRQWAIEARSARLHKPHYLDTHNPFLMYVLAKQARANDGGTVLFQECLPGAERYAESGNPDSAEEFFVEFTLSGGGNDN